MKKLPIILSVLIGCFTQSSFAANIDITKLGSVQTDFKNFSEDMGSALSYKAVTPAEPLGITGFDIGIEATSTDTKSLAKVTGTSDTTLIIPKLHIHKGLPFGIDFGASYSSVENIKLVGAELRYAILEGGVAMPAIALRGAMSKLSGVDQLAFSTRSLDVSISKGFAMITPYAGVGTVWVDSAPDIVGLTKESFQQAKTFAGANLNLGLTNIAVEWDKTGAATSTSVKLGLRF